MQMSIILANFAFSNLNNNSLESFKRLGLSKPILKVIEELGFEKPSQIQELAIPQIIQGNRDFIGLAQTGTGKTAAFGWPLLERIDPSLHYTQGLILAPTRELGQQIAGQIEVFSKFMDQVNVLAVYGGASIVDQIRALRKPQHIIIATPGRLIDLIKRKSVKLDKLKFLVLDEADEMLNMGFKEDLDTILEYTPEEKVVWLFSATMSPEIRRIVKTYMEHPAEVKLNVENEVNANILHQFAVVKQSDKSEALTRFLDVDPDIRGVVFCRTRQDTQELADLLLKKNYRAEALHGDLSQKQRDRVMDLFKRKALQVLIATDIAARGIDVNDLTHVFHVSLPDDLSYYTHRSGRTARAGKKGISLAIINVHEREKLHRISKTLDIQFQQVLVPQTREVYSLKVENWCRGILDKPGKNAIEAKLLEKASLLFGSLSKEELIAKLLTTEIEKWNVGANVDLNFDFSKPAGGKGSSMHKPSQPKKTFSSGKRSFSKKKTYGKRPVG